MMRTYETYRRLVTYPLGRRLFSLLYAVKAPYFWTVRPQVLDMGPHHAEVVVPLRWAVKNHIGTLHAIAAVNGLEAAMGLLAEATCPPDKRWIPVGMTVRYTAKSTTDLRCTADTDPGPGRTATSRYASRPSAATAWSPSRGPSRSGSAPARRPEAGSWWLSRGDSCPSTARAGWWSI